ncbi:hypothetical protein IB276_33280 [Ensifer sp. ENS04]|uniref:hypothetical protein n=1 Tax=Ensifer sp. ENS04 TaxID=2769281 RepID=UPI00177E5383|nr:hypothetical protein [Ensifer sp. ENS04]MBD9544321.1 hypothetical protein [Ensifer sp. ENS04]
MTSNFHAFAKAVESRFRTLSAGELFVVEVEDLFDIYLSAFPEGTNPIYRVRTEHDGSIDKSFIRRVGNVVAIKDGKIETLWDGLQDLEYPYNAVAADLAHHVRRAPIRGVFRTNEHKFGAEKTYEQRETGVHTWNHFFCTVSQRHRSSTPDAARGQINTTAQVFRRGLDELTLDSIETVVDLIDSNSLYRGAEHKAAIDEFLAMRRAYDQAKDKNLFVWANVDSRAARFRNSVIGTLITDLSTGEELDKAVRSFETKVAPENYKRPTALITPKMIEQATSKLSELGLESAVERRFAKLSDVSVNNVLFVDNSVRGAMKEGLTTLLMEAVKPATVDIKHAEEITVDEFLANIVPQVSSIDLLLQNKHLSNFMSLTAPVHADAGQLFKWDNGFAWSYDGDAADSIKQRVKRAGGNVEADLRVSLAWSNTDDLDLHVREPGGNHIHFGNKDGKLDVDMNCFGTLVRDPVENVVWNKRQLRDGQYLVWVNNYSRRESVDVGFTIELEFAGHIQQFTYDRGLASKADVRALVLTVKNGVLINVEVGAGLAAGSASQEKWGVNTETLVPVNTLLASPNHWDGQALGNKHWFFILKDCLNPGSVRGVYNEFLRSSLDEHRKVFEVLGAKTKAPFSADQLSGVGFSSTRQDEATVVVKGNRINKAFKIKF